MLTATLWFPAASPATNKSGSSSYRSTMVRPIKQSASSAICCWSRLWMLSTLSWMCPDGAIKKQSWIRNNRLQDRHVKRAKLTRPINSNMKYLTCKPLPIMHNLTAMIFVEVDLKIHNFKDGAKSTATIVCASPFMNWCKVWQDQKLLHSPPTF